MKLAGVFAAAALAAGCASYDGYTLVPGKSTAAEVEQTMGTPAARLQRGSESIWYYPRGPLGFHSFAVRIGPDGVMREIDQRLTTANVQKLNAGSSTREDVRELFGPPFVVSSLTRLQREVWEYQMYDEAFIRRKLWLQYSSDGVLREVLLMRHPDEDPPGGTKD